jgi:hypothetical protein
LGRPCAAELGDSSPAPISNLPEVRLEAGQTSQTHRAGSAP